LLLASGVNSKVYKWTYFNNIMNNDLYSLPKIYMYTHKILDKDGKITDRVTSGLENVLHAYSIFIPEYASVHDNNPKNFQVSKVYLVGSAARENRIDSDLDLMLIAPQIDERSERDIKVWMSVLFFNNKPKTEAVDVFVRPYDRYPDRSSMDITGQVKKLLKQYNAKLLKK
jgi:hypothetical protein